MAQKVAVSFRPFFRPLYLFDSLDFLFEITLEIAVLLNTKRCVLFFDKLVKIVFAEAFIQFQPLIVKDKAFYDELPQSLSCPNAKLGSLGAIDAIADGNDGIKVVKIDEIILFICGSCPEFPEN